MPDRRKFLEVILILIVLALAGLGSGILWQRHQRAGPAPAFWEALRHNLSETGLTCTTSETAAGQTIKQAVSLDLASKVNARSLTTLTQQNSSVKSEEITVKSGDYIRYTAITAAAKNPSGAKPDFSKALNVWAKNDAGAGQPGLFGRAALGNCIVPLAYLTPPQVTPLMLTLQKGTVFKTDFKAAKSAQLNGQTVRVYDVTVQPRPYVDFMKQVAKISGLKDLESVDAASFDKKPAEKLKFYISLSPARLQKIEYAGAEHSIIFSDYGNVPRVSAPSKPISVPELRQRLLAP